MAMYLDCRKQLLREKVKAYVIQERRDKGSTCASQSSIAVSGSKVAGILKSKHVSTLTDVCHV